MGFLDMNFYKKWLHNFTQTLSLKGRPQIPIAAEAINIPPRYFSLPQFQWINTTTVSYEGSLAFSSFWCLRKRTLMGQANMKSSKSQCIHYRFSSEESILPLWTHLNPVWGWEVPKFWSSRCLPRGIVEPQSNIVRSNCWYSTYDFSQSSIFFFSSEKRKKGAVKSFVVKVARASWRNLHISNKFSGE